MPHRSLPHHDPNAAHESPLQAISNAMAQIYKAQFGRGPTKVKTYFAGPDAIVCILEDTQTPAETRLAELGEHERLREIRLFFQYAAEEDLKRPVEAATGRRVRAFISGADVRADASVEVFLLDEAPDAPYPPPVERTAVPTAARTTDVR